MAKLLGRSIVLLVCAAVLRFAFQAPVWAAFSVGWIISYLAIPERAA